MSDLYPELETGGSGLRHRRPYTGDVGVEMQTHSMVRYPRLTCDNEKGPEGEVALPLDFVYDTRITGKVAWGQARNIQHDDEETPDDDDGEEEEGIVEHHVLPGDTLQGLAVQYGLTMEQIRKENALPETLGACMPIPKSVLIIFPGIFPRVPRNEREKRARVKMFQHAMPGMTKEEAEFYLKETQYDVAKAVSQCKDDLEWEEQNAPM